MSNFPETTFFSFCTSENYPVHHRNRSQTSICCFLRWLRAVPPYLFYNFPCVSYKFWRFWSIVEMLRFSAILNFSLLYIISVSKHNPLRPPELRTDQNWLHQMTRSKAARFAVHLCFISSSWCAHSGIFGFLATCRCIVTFFKSPSSTEYNSSLKLKGGLANLS